MTDEEFTREQMDEQRKEVSRLRSELKAFNKARAAMSKEDKEKTSFITPCVTYCFIFMPFGLKSVGSTFARVV